MKIRHGCFTSDELELSLLDVLKLLCGVVLQGSGINVLMYPWLDRKPSTHEERNEDA